MSENARSARACDEALERLEFFLDGELPAPEATAVQAHLDSCPRCAAALGQLRSFKDRVRGAARSVPVEPRLEELVRSRLREREQRKLFWLPGRGAWMAAAAAMVMVVTGAVAYQLGHLRLTTASQERFITSISGRVSGLMRVGLGDHVHCTVYRKYPRQPPELEDLVRNMEPQFRALVVAVRQQVPADYRILMAHHCKYRGRRFVHIAMRGDGQLISLILAKKEEGETFSIGQLAPALQHAGISLFQAGANRFQLAAFETGQYLAYVVSDLPKGRNMEIMTALAPAVRDYLGRLES